VKNATAFNQNSSITKYGMLVK